MSQETLTGKVALITGGNSGIGLATVKLFLSHGARVIALDRDEFGDGATENFLPLQCDVSSEEDVAKAVEAGVEKFGTIHILCNIAGVVCHKKLPHEITTAEWRRIMDINVTGPFFVVRAVVPYMLKNDSEEKGVIINTGSGAAVRGANAGTVYTASKHALLGFSRSIAWLYRNQGIRVNLVHPGATKSNIVVNSHGGPKSGVKNPTSFSEITDPDIKPYLMCCPGINDPEDVAAGYLFLATAKGAVGVELPIDQGWLLA